MQLGNKKSKIASNTITILKVKLRCDFNTGIGNSSYIDETKWDSILSNQKLIDENIAENELSQYLLDSETKNEKHKREFMKKNWNKDVGFKEARTEKFKKFRDQLMFAEQQMQEMHYFQVRNLFLLNFSLSIVKVLFLG